ncbi:sugar ABC transporter substrate-binding protein [Mesorhizobium sp. LMG 17147]|uniref:sugar ABC transporter substrate-binding protein n=1 Tax=Mesorhizobium sp. LMG 17147 TaxID=2963091 RepID=UPI0020CA0AAF|nr:sugar ABC transporter substrate-binding protein [Mesorhizobium sp. LMG 17147]MCP9233124.1 sugar ABC transporter substrate-binding protein [Mesorhizobium sp. LMG 17147]
MNRKLFAGLAIAIALSVPASAADKIKAGLITKFPVPFYSTMEDAAKKYAAAHPEIELVTGQGQAATDIEGQIALIESMITQGVKGLAITPVDPTVAPALDKAVSAGIKVVLVDNSIPNWKGQTALVSTNNLNGGKIAGEYLKTVLKSGDKIGILQGVPGVPALDDRVTGMMEGLGDVKVDVVGKGATNCTLELGTSVTEDILTANPDLKAIYSACGPPIPGAVKSISNAGIANDNLIVVGFDACCGEIEAIKSGAEDASVAQFPAKMGELGIDTVVKAIRGESVEANVDTGAGLVTLQNVKDFE